MCLLFATPWTAVLQATLSLISSQSLPKFMSVTLSNHLILWCPLLFFPSIFLSLRGFSNKLGLWFASGGLSIGDSASASVLPMSIQSWFLLGLPGLSPCYPWDSRVFSSTTISQITSYNWKFNSLAIHLAVWFGIAEKWKLTKAALHNLT